MATWMYVLFSLLKGTKGEMEDFEAGLESSGVKNKCALLIRMLKINMCIV